MAKDKLKIVSFSNSSWMGEGWISIRYPASTHRYVIPTSASEIFELNKLYNTANKRQRNVGKLALLIKKLGWKSSKIGVDVKSEIESISKLLK